MSTSTWIAGPSGALTVIVDTAASGFDRWKPLPDRSGITLHGDGFRHTAVAIPVELRQDFARSRDVVVGESKADGTLGRAWRVLNGKLEQLADAAAIIAERAGAALKVFPAADPARARRHIGTVVAAMMAAGVALAPNDAQAFQGTAASGEQQAASSLQQDLAGNYMRLNAPVIMAEVEVRLQKERDRDGVLLAGASTGDLFSRHLTNFISAAAVALPPVFYPAQVAINGIEGVNDLVNGRIGEASLSVVDAIVPGTGVLRGVGGGAALVADAVEEDGAAKMRRKVISSLTGKEDRTAVTAEELNRRMLEQKNREMAQRMVPVDWSKAPEPREHQPEAPRGPAPAGAIDWSIKSAAAATDSSPEP